MKIKTILLLSLLSLSLSLSTFAQIPEEELLYPAEDPQMMEEPVMESEEFYPQREEDLNYHVPSENPDEYVDPEMMNDPEMDYEN